MGLRERQEPVDVAARLPRLQVAPLGVVGRERVVVVLAQDVALGLSHQPSPLTSTRVNTSRRREERASSSRFGREPALRR